MDHILGTFKTFVYTMCSNRGSIRSCTNSAIPQPTIPNSRLTQAWATATAIIREIKHPQYYIPLNGLKWATPLPLGRILTLFVYWAVVIYFMSWNVSIKDALYWERIGFRNAWVSICQLPMLYLLAMKFNPVGYLIGSSHERLNWLHRWVGRTMFITATVHGWHFWTEWVLADFVEYELSIMPLVKYGLAAWGVLLWTVVVGFLPLRRLSYEIWLVQHIVSAVVMLWLLYEHIPVEARYLLWMSVAFLAADRFARWANLAVQNIRFKSADSTCLRRQFFGHSISAQSVGVNTTVLTVKDVHFSWKPGQHVYLWIPKLGPFEAHPYTIACARQIDSECCCHSIQFIVRAHGGFSKRVKKYATESEGKPLTGFLSGPYGAPPNWNAYETLVLIGASTGASFTIPILEAVAQKSRHATCVRRIDAIILAKTSEEVRYYVERGQDAARRGAANGIDVRIHIAITGSAQSECSTPLVRHRRVLSSDSCCCAVLEDESSGSDEKGTVAEQLSDDDSNTTTVHEYNNRPDIAALIQDPVEAAWGETAVVVCGGKEIVAATRNCVSRLSDDRAVHKGTGAQGIYLHVEEYSF